MLVYLLFLAPGILLALWAQSRITSAYRHASQIPSASGYTGAEAADALLRAAGVGASASRPSPAR